jgi:flagella basal body P-ring formation protein FlgA
MINSKRCLLAVFTSLQKGLRPSVMPAKRCLLTTVIACIYSSSAIAKLPVGNTTQLVEQAARAHLTEVAENAGLIEPQFDIAAVKSSRPIPECASTPAIEPLDARMPSRMRFAVVCPGPSGWRQEVVVRASISARVAVTATAITAGKPFASDDITLQRRDISMIGDSIADPVLLEGLSSRRALRAGEVLRKSQLLQIPLVKKGEVVRIVARRDQVEVTMTGEALDAGPRDAVVRVRNASSGNVIRARVTAEGEVEPVDLAGTK